MRGLFRERYNEQFSKEPAAKKKKTQGGGFSPIGQAKKRKTSFKLADKIITMNRAEATTNISVPKLLMLYLTTLIKIINLM